MTSGPDLSSAYLAAVRTARSLLFVPGDRPDRFEKAVAAGADLVILDLEDAVADGHKERARRLVSSWLANGGCACVRVNAVARPEHDLDLAVLSGLDGLVAIVLPKAVGATEATSIAQRSGAPVIALVESAAGMLGVNELASANGVARLAFGHLDYAVDLGCSNDRVAMAHARSTLVLASRAAGLPGPIDGVTVTLDDPAVLRDDIRAGRQLGMTGKLLIHPRQVAPTHAAFEPTEAEVRWARKVLAAADSSHSGAARVDGDMVDAPVIARARAILRTKER